MESPWAGRLPRVGRESQGGSLPSIPRQVPTAGQEHLLSEHLTPPELRKWLHLNPEIIRSEGPQSAPSRGTVPGTVPGADAGAYKSVLLECPSKERCSKPQKPWPVPFSSGFYLRCLQLPPKVITLAPAPSALFQVPRRSNAVFLRWDFDFEAEIITSGAQVRTAGWVGLGCHQSLQQSRR